MFKGKEKATVKRNHWPQRAQGTQRFLTGLVVSAIVLLDASPFGYAQGRLLQKAVALSANAFGLHY
jgi:hypothetical protein